MINYEKKLKRAITSRLKSLTEHKNTMTYTCNFGNPDPDIGLAQQCGGFKPVYGIPTLRSQP
jgi:hypothetical protein